MTTSSMLNPSFGEYKQGGRGEEGSMGYVCGGQESWQEQQQWANAGLSNLDLHLPPGARTVWEALLCSV